MTVVGAGIIGLSTGIELQAAGFDVRILTRDLPLATTSANSGAIWGPFLSTIDGRVLAWSYATLGRLRSFADVAGSGVQVVSGICAADMETEPPRWVLDAGGVGNVDISFLPPKYVTGWRYEVPIMDMPLYLTFLLHRFLDSGGVLCQTDLTDMRQLDRENAGHIVLCIGYGAVRLLEDESVVPSKGQLVVVRNPGIQQFFAERGDGPELLYILPQGGKVVLGGTAEDEYECEGFDPGAANSIIDRCSKIDHRLASSEVLGHRVGIRPGRSRVRLEHDVLDSGVHVVYNYGHGGSGVSLSWGCARTVVDIVRGCAQTLT